MSFLKSRGIRIVVLITFLFAFAFLIYGCSAPTEDAMTDRGIPEAEAPDHANQDAPVEDSSSEREGTHKISRADVRLEVEDLDDSVGLLEEKAKDMGGFVSYSSINKRERNPHATVTLRVPADKFYLMLDEIEEAGEVEYRSTSEEDVTRRYIDLEARINNLTSQEKRLTEILQMADNVTDVLSVEQELERVRGEIEALTGEFNYLKNQVNMATISIHLSETTLASSGITSIDFGDMFTRGYHSFINSMNAVIMSVRGLFIFVMGSIPYIIILGIIIVVLRKPYSKLKEKRQRAKTPPDNNVQS